MPWTCTFHWHRKSAVLIDMQQVTKLAEIATIVKKKIYNQFCINTLYSSLFSCEMHLLKWQHKTAFVKNSDSPCFCTHEGATDWKKQSQQVGMIAH